VSAPARAVVLPARAKLNLDLKVVGRRPDGLHELRTTMQAIDLHDVLEIERAGATSFAVSGFEVDEHANTVLRAQAAMEAAAGRPLPAAFRLHKRIPPGSGLGGASSDAAAAMHALAALYCDDVDLRAVAAGVGADVTFFVSGGAALVTGTGEQVSAAEMRDAWFAIAWPGIELSTAAVYRAWDELGGEGPNELRRAAAHVDGRVEEFSSRLGAGWQMTGSGSAFFKQCATVEAARAAAETLGCWTAVSRAMGPWA
jgi:4-diphosphocytidyl-2-C-methyl-D-erythritol kinase